MRYPSDIGAAVVVIILFAAVFYALLSARKEKGPLAGLGPQAEIVFYGFLCSIVSGFIVGYSMFVFTRFTIK